VDNLQLYDVYLSELTKAQREVFPSCVIGQLARIVTENDFLIGLNEARNVAKVLRPERETTVRDITSRRRPS